jgi:membrane-associated protease RseP (regulator of RpoE activity)
VIQLLVVVGLLAVILVHELGHLLAAKATGIRATVFSLGIGPALIRKSWRGIEWRLSALPLGGYVRIPAIMPPDPIADRLNVARLCHVPAGAMPGDEPSDPLGREQEAADDQAPAPEPLLDEASIERLRNVETSDQLYAFMDEPPSGLTIKGQEQWQRLRDEHAPDTYNRASWPRRTAVILAGSAVNIIGGALLLWVALLVHSPLYHTTWKVADAKAPLSSSLVGQRVLQLNDEGLTFSDSRKVRDVSAFAKAYPGKAIIVLSSGKLMAAPPGAATISRSDVSFAGYRHDVGAKEALHGSLDTVHLILSNTWQITTKVFVDKKVRRSTGTVVGAVHSAPQAANFLPQYILILSIAIGMINLLPLLPLDGGHFVMSTLRALHVPLPRAAWYLYGLAGLIFVLALFSIGLTNDLRAF